MGSPSRQKSLSPPSDPIDYEGLARINRTLAVLASRSSTPAVTSAQSVSIAGASAEDGQDNPERLNAEDPDDDSGGVPMRASQGSTESTQAQDLKEASKEILQSSVAEFKIGFDPATFPQVIADKLPHLREQALPGSFDHLLLILFDGINSYHKIHQTMVGNIPNYLETHQSEVLFADSHRDRGIFRLLNPRRVGETYEPATLQARSTMTNESRLIDERFFHNELLLLRELVAPLRDSTKPIYWITNRSNMIHEMVDDFDWSVDLIAKFKKYLKNSLWDHHENWTIYNPSPPGCETRESNISLHQWRIDASRATTIWEKFPPNELQLRDGPGKYRLIITANPDLARTVGFLPPLEMPIPQTKVSSKREITLQNKKLDAHYGEGLSLLVQIAEWLALARGYPAVHLFCDIVRLFTVYGVDVANATQVEFCNHLLNCQITEEDPAQHSLIPYILGKNRVVAETNAQYIQDILDTNSLLQLQLLEVDSLLSRDDDSISWDYPLQILMWVTEGSERKLALNERFSPWDIAARNGIYSWGDEDKDDGDGDGDSDEDEDEDQPRGRAPAAPETSESQPTEEEIAADPALQEREFYRRRNVSQGSLHGLREGWLDGNDDAESGGYW